MFGNRGCCSAGMRSRGAVGAASLGTTRPSTTLEPCTRPLGLGGGSGGNLGGGSTTSKVTVNEVPSAARCFECLRLAADQAARHTALERLRFHAA